MPLRCCTSALLQVPQIGVCHLRTVALLISAALLVCSNLSGRTLSMASSSFSQETWRGPEIHESSMEDCDADLSPGNFATTSSSRRKKQFYPPVTFRVGFWQNGFFADFYFWAAGFSRGFCPRIFPPHFCGKKVPRKILQENPRQNPPKFIQQKSPTHFCRGAGPITSRPLTC